MRNVIAAVLVIALFTACSAEVNSPTEERPGVFEIFLNPSSLNLAVDETAIVDVDSEAPLREVKWKWEGGERAHQAMSGSSLDKNLKLYFQFPFPGNHPVLLEFTDLDGKLSSKQLNFNVSRGNTVQITKIEVQSFYDMGNVWDPEAGEQNALADLIFILLKQQHTGFVSNTYSSGSWYVSEVHENESSLSWDLTEKQLFLDPHAGFSFGLEDRDESNMGQNLLLNHHSYSINLTDKIEARPETVTLIDEEVDLHVTFHLDWP